MLRRVTGLGALGSALVAASSWWVGAVPVSFRSRPPSIIDRFDIGSALPRGVYYLGLVLLTAAWLLGTRQLLRSERQVDRGALVTAILVWAAPLLAAMPVASRDVWAYAAQGHLDHRGFDPYAVGPSRLPGIFADNVSGRWIDSTSPYGPLWTLIGRGVAVPTGEHVQGAVFLLRLPALVGFLLTVWALPRIARRIGRRADLALWLGGASPLMLVIGLGGSHNDLLMVGLAALGVAAAVSRGSPLNTLGLAATLAAAGAAVKSPALIAVAFVVPLWLQYSDRHRRDRSWRRVAVAAGVAGCCALISFGLFTMLAQYGLGWARQTSSDAQANWLSLPSTAAMLVRLASGHTTGVTTVDAAMRAWRYGGLALAGLVLLGLWLLAIRATLRDRCHVLAPTTALATGLAAIVVLGPAVQPWYFVWSLPFAALAVAWRAHPPVRVIGAIAAAVVGLGFVVRPDGRGVQMQPIVLAVIAAAAMAGYLTVRGLAPPRTKTTPDEAAPAMAKDSAGNGSVAGDDDADGTRAGVGADRSSDL